MKIAIPTSGGALASHFGHCEQFSVYEVDGASVRATDSLTPPNHEPGAFPRFLRAEGIDVIIAGGMGQRAQGLFADANITVVCGAGGTDPAQMAEAYAKGNLVSGDNACDH